MLAETHSQACVRVHTCTYAHIHMHRHTHAQTYAQSRREERERERERERRFLRDICTFAQAHSAPICAGRINVALCTNLTADTEGSMTDDKSLGQTATFTRNTTAVPLHRSI